ncbi:Maf family nucleotide pyrophosphatase [Microbulbifer sp. OS29]|uniref:7-methyl-GTP pyrophosphatase n=1 Tax=Microbulbifer okhotskensis TaxID=2926617 RepID=A0A9X2EKR7_9GAMM|nr:Maf family protein [Microbulbifer okhotskensis]MCO1333997.1 Maf family nucleotide pyrophosphatase [Microbulbifer okhotskensis]
MSHPLMLASGSPYRRTLLQQLGLPFQHASPQTDETPRAGEPADALSLRLASEKAQALATSYPKALIIGSDQVASCNSKILGKPGSQQRAIEQLQTCSGQKVVFHTGLSVLNSESGEQLSGTETFTVYFRDLSHKQIERYVALEQPYDCAGSFRVEGLGIVLFEKLEGSDINTLVGLPLIRLVSMLANFGVDPLDPRTVTPVAAS